MFKNIIVLFQQVLQHLYKMINILKKNDNKDGHKNQHQYEKVRDKRRQSKCINVIIKCEFIMINQHQNI